MIWQVYRAQVKRLLLMERGKESLGDSLDVAYIVLEAFSGPTKITVNAIYWLFGWLFYQLSHEPLFFCGLVYGVENSVFLKLI